MKRLLFVAIILLFTLTGCLFFYLKSEREEKAVTVAEVVEAVKPATPELPESYLLYRQMQLEDIVDYQAFEQAYIGYNKIETKHKEVLTLIDFSKPSTEERMYVLDMANKKLLYSSLVAHGKNSGDLYATSFSNVNGSNKSSLGFYLTENTYYGGSGYSLILNGLEKGINDKAKQRAIVIHGSKYVEPSRVASVGKIGKSLGCPAIPRTTSKEIINAIKGGSLLFIYADNEDYLVQSPILAGEDILGDFWG